MLDRLPAKGPLLGFAVMAVSLAVTARFAGRGVEAVKEQRARLAGPELIDPDLQRILPPAFAAALRAEAGLPGSDGSSDGGPAEEVAPLIKRVYLNNTEFHIRPAMQCLLWTWYGQHDFQ